MLTDRDGVSMSLCMLALAERLSCDHICVSERMTLAQGNLWEGRKEGPEAGGQEKFLVTLQRR